MHRKNSVIGILVPAVALGLAGAPVTGGQPAADAGTTAQAQPSAACDYADPYNGTIGSVVRVSQQRGQGSGFVYEALDNATSYIVTNRHVVGDASRVEISFHDGETRTGPSWAPPSARTSESCG